MAPTRLTFTVEEAAAELRISDTSVYRLISAGEIQTCDVSATGGRAKTRITLQQLEAFLASRSSDRPAKAS